MLFADALGMNADDVLQWLQCCESGIEKERASVLATWAVNPSREMESLVQHFDDYYNAAIGEIETLAVLVMIASAEARLRIDTRARCNEGDNLSRRLSVLKKGANSDWGIALSDRGILDAWKEHIANTSLLTDQEKESFRRMLGNFKAVLPVRHWIAHGRYWPLAGEMERYAPWRVAKVVDKLINGLEQVAQATEIKEFYCRRGVASCKSSFYESGYLDTERRMKTARQL